MMMAIVFTTLKVYIADCASLQSLGVNAEMTGRNDIKLVKLKFQGMQW